MNMNMNMMSMNMNRIMNVKNCASFILNYITKAGLRNDHTKTCGTIGIVSTN